jgi:hypothetical protein
MCLASVAKVLRIVGGSDKPEYVNQSFAGAITFASHSTNEFRGRYFLNAGHLMAVPLSCGTRYFDPNI